MTETEIIAQIDAARDLNGLENVRIALLGKSGSISALLKTLGAMTPEQRQAEGPRINGLRGAATDAIAAKRLLLRRRCSRRGWRPSAST